MYFHCFIGVEMMQVVEILTCGRQRPVYPTQLALAADDLATQGVRILAGTLFSWLTRNIWASAMKGLTLSTL